ncbi:hypothetical protein [Flavobacterium silvaticum]|uniref:NUMOD4 domain-containing protein n=1 Tax=Flavobacterium silvaticum TaxID=1852020 RepID=A0A972FKE3_9FLAO|nr:hypothetical protein [Flavobacterium silvaticum]NMH27302.1 hypothetical protein [Flavobacterium silvaticum]
MIRLFPGEEFREVHFAIKPRMRYAVSNRGRILSFSDNLENGALIKGSTMNGYRMIRFKKVIEGKMHNIQSFVYKFVAEHFLPQPDEVQKHLIHLDHDLSNDRVENLKWVDADARMEHYKKSPNVIAGRKRMLEKRKSSNGHKLTLMEVIRLKKMVLDPNRKTRMKILAKQFGISEMQLFRIKSGENWGHIKV